MTIRKHSRLQTVCNVCKPHYKKFTNYFGGYLYRLSVFVSCGPTQQHENVEIEFLHVRHLVHHHWFVNNAFVNGLQVGYCEWPCEFHKFFWFLPQLQMCTWIYICNTFTPQIKGKCHCINVILYCTGSGMLMRYAHWYQCVYLVMTFHKFLKLFDGKMKVLHAIYSHYQLDIDYGF